MSLKRVGLIVIGSLLSLASPSIAAERPNVIFILCDDLGYGDVGVFYQNARAADGKPAFATPHLDALAAAGMMLTSHYTAAPVCAPARASLMTGESQGQCTVRDNQFDKPLAPGVLTLGDVMKQAGYRTMAIGKWGLGGHGQAEGWPAHPMKRGFDDYFGFMRHGWGHTYYHDEKHPLMDGMKSVRGEYENVYSTDLFTARAKRFITEQHEQKPGQPFFLYLAYTAVHGVLEVPGGPYPAGGGLTGGVKWPVAPTPETRDKWIYPEYASQTGWTDPMKRYATMARRMDQGVGDVMQLLKDLKIDKDTMVVFTSDNGPENWVGADPRLFDSWGPFDGFKRDLWEGGMREPTMVVWPGHVPAGRKSDAASVFYDWMPTLAEVAGAPSPAQSDGVSILPTLTGKGEQAKREYLYSEYSFAAQNYPPAERDVFARKHVTARGQQQWVRMGDFVGVRTDIRNAEDPLRLYDVVKDPHEDHDLAAEPGRSGVMARMREILATARVPDADAPRPYDAVPMPAVAGGGAAGSLTRVVVESTAGYTPGHVTFAHGPKETSPGVTLPPNAPAGAFAAEFTGFLTVPTDGAYTFTATADAGVHLWLHDAHVLGSESPAGKPINGVVRLRAGAHPFRLAYRHGVSGTPALSLHYSGPSLEERAVPPDAFSRAKD